MGRDQGDVSEKDRSLMPSFPSLVIGFLGPLAIVSFARLINLAERPMHTAWHFLTGAFLAFVALIAERYLFGWLGRSVPPQWQVAAEAFLFVALVEEIVKIAQIAELSRRKSASLSQTMAIGLAVAAGFAGAENVIYLFRYSDHIGGLLMLRTLTANPLHLATGVIASYYVFESLHDEGKSHYLAIAVLVAAFFHGLYDYLIMESRGRSLSFVFVLAFVVIWAWRLSRKIQKIA